MKNQEILEQLFDNPLRFKPIFNASVEWLIEKTKEVKKLEAFNTELVELLEDVVCAYKRGRHDARLVHKAERAIEKARGE